LKTRQKGQGGVGHVEAFQLILDSQKGVWIDPQERISGQAEPEQVRNAAECLIVDDRDPVIGQVEHHQTLDLETACSVNL
jgi:hypothetical protein